MGKSDFLIKNHIPWKLSTELAPSLFPDERAKNLLEAKINYRLILINYKRQKRNHLNLMEIF